MAAIHRLQVRAARAVLTQAVLTQAVLTQAVLALTVLALTVLALAVLAEPAGAQFLRVYYPDIEQGSATLVVSPTGKALLIDAGTDIKDVDEGVEHFINDLIDAGVVASVDFVVATHYDEDHIGRMENVFQYVPLSGAIVSYDRGEFLSVPSTFAYSDYSFGASLNNRTTVACSANAFDLDLGGGVTVKFATVNGEVCGGPTVDVSGASQFENNVSVTVVVRYGDFDLWIGGDLTGNPETGVADVETPTGAEVMDVDVYTVNHHGSETSSNASFLADLAAEVAINQSSIENSFGHPRATIVNRIKGTPDTHNNTPVFYQQNPSDPTDSRTDDSLADAIADCDDAAAGQVIGLPGTIVLLSDGTSYRIHACGIAATEYPADAGTGTIGDYPPAVRRVLHTPRVPLSTESVSVEADLEDVSSAEIRYWLDGVEQTPASMSLSSGITYTGTIPSQANGTRVEFRVSATDSSSQTEVSQEGCYYAGVTPVSTFRVNDAAGVLAHVTCGVRVEGNMTVEPGVLHPTVTLAYVQDATGGVQVFDKTIDPAIARGDLVQWVGELEQFGGQTEVSVAEDFGNFGSTRIGSGTAPSPTVVTVSQVGEGTEGKLIRLNGLSVVSGSIPESGSGSLVVTDNGGTSTIEVRIDGDTNVPGANTPTQTFDLIAVSSQFDSWVALDSGYQVVPRERADFITDEVNHPQVVISEIHADPDSTIAGDANGDGVRDAEDDEFVEILNTGTTAVDVSGWKISDATGLRHVFPASTVIPPHEAAVVFGGGAPTGAFGNAAANGLVFTASTGTLGLNNTADTVTLADAASAAVQAVTYGSEANSDESIVRDPDFSNAPFVRHTIATGAGGSLYSPGTRINGKAFTVPQGAVLLTEVMYDPAGADTGLEWIEIYNATGAAIDLADLCLGAGGGDYTNTLIPLDGCAGGCTIAAGATFVVGGPTSNANNAAPTFDLVLEIIPGLQNSGADADGVALFNFRCAQVDAITVPIDAVVYGTTNTNGLIDETGSAGAPEVGDAASGQSIERVDLAGTWQIQAAPTPGTTPVSGANTPPAVTITAPADSSTHTEGVSVSFTATASDTEDGDLTSSIGWTSSLDGNLGTGGSIAVSTLSVGTHMITAAVTDSGSLQGTDQITLTVEAAPAGGLILSEVFYDAAGSDDGLEWVELYNSSGSSINLSGYSLGAGGSDYTNETVQLSGTIAAGATFVVGGPTSNSSNGSPTFNQTFNFSPDLQNGGSVADGVALFNVAAASITASTVPIDAVVYGGSNSSGLIDETGAANPPEVGTAAAGSSIERTNLAGSWQTQSTPTPNSTPLN